jgi:hypothetical protein
MDRIGVTRTRSGEIDIRYVPCEGEAVLAVGLETSDKGFTKSTGRLWAITSEGGSKRESYPVGAVPHGFIEELPLRHLPDANVPLAATLESSSDGRFVFNFRQSDIFVNQILTRGRVLKSETDFEASAEKSCDD